MVNSYQKNIYLVLLLLFIGCDSQLHQHEKLKLAHAHDQKHPIHQSMIYFADVLDSLSGGELEIQIYSGAQLGKEREALELLQIGTLDITKVSAALMENYLDVFELISYPYLFKDKAHFQRAIHTEVKDSLLNHVSQIRLTGLTFLDAGSRNVYTASEKIQTPADFAGQKLRVMQSSTMIKMAKSLGASPTPIAMSELYTALQQGMVDGAENNLPTFYASRHFEVCNYFHFTEHVYVPDILVISEYRWSRLSERHKKIIQQAADATSFYHEKLWMEAENNALKQLKAEGVEIIYPNKSAFIEKTASFYNQLDASAEISHYIQLISNLENASYEQNN